MVLCSGCDTPQRGSPPTAKDVAMQDTGAAKHPAKAGSTKESDGEETVQTPLERCTPGTPKAHTKIPPQKKFTEKQTNK